MLKVSDLLTVEELVGFKFVDNAMNPDEVDADIVTKLAYRSLYKIHRIIHPGTIVTMDFRPDRVNININEEGIIVSVGPG